MVQLSLLFSGGKEGPKAASKATNTLLKAWSVDCVVLKKKLIFSAWQQLYLAWSAAQALADKTALRGFAISQPSGSFQGKTSEGPNFIMV